MNLEPLLDSLSQRAASSNPGDYEQNGLLYCGGCNTPKQCRISINGREKIVYCLCKCQNQRQLAAESEQRATNRKIYIDKLRERCISDTSLRGNRFSDTETGSMAKAKAYATRFDEMRSKHIGLLFWGGVGTGKTYAASCIANDLIQRNIAVMMTSLPKIINSDRRQELITSITKFDLLVLDDLGAERNSDFAQETAYQIVDEWYKTGKPLIVTTNLTLDEIKNPKNPAYSRIYDRITEMCIPVLFNGTSRRKTVSAEKIRIARELFGGGEQHE